MRRSGWFERRLLVALILFSLVPTLVVVGTGTLILREAVSLQTTPAGWERLGETGRELLEAAESSGDVALRDAAERHREELTVSIQQAQRWGYLNRRVLEVLPWVSGIFVGAILLMGIRWARRTARGLASPIHELVGWSGKVARGEPLPPAESGTNATAGEFAVLRDSFRTMARQIEDSRAREVEAARMRASVSIARGVAHELKNALTPLRLAVRALAADRTLGDAAREPLEVIDAESDRLQSLARAFSQFGHPPSGPRSPVDLVEMFEYLGRSHLPPEVEFDLSPADASITVSGYHDALSRAFANLLLNSVEAMSREESAGGKVRVELAASGPETVTVRIIDNGPGLPPGFEERAWDPDFTTKARGTGLGLALVRQTILAHGGEIRARNVAGGGAAFTITLPVSGRPEAIGDGAAAAEDTVNPRGAVAVQPGGGPAAPASASGPHRAAAGPQPSPVAEHAPRAGSALPSGGAAADGS